MLNKPSIILVGAGGHAMSCIDNIEAQNIYQIRGLIGTQAEIGKSHLGYPVIGSDDMLEKLRNDCVYALVCLGQIKSAAIRIRIFKKLVAVGYELPTIQSPFARVSPHAKIGRGTIVMHGATVNAGAVIGENCIINSHALIEHGVKIESHCHIATGARINGDAAIGSESFIGSGVIIREGIRIGHSCLVAMGQVLHADLQDGLVMNKVRS